MNLTSKKIIKDINEVGASPRHNVEALKNACQKVGKNTKIKPYALFRLLCFNESIKGFYTHSYGFHTSTGRYLIDQLQNQYYNEVNK